MADQPRPTRSDESSSAISADSAVVLIAFSAIFLLVTAVTGAAGDYDAYVLRWRSVLTGHDPWQTAWPFNAYGPLFNLMAPAVWLSPLANKVVFALAYVFFLVWLRRAFAPAQGTRPPEWLWFGLLILNPFPWEQIAWMGYFDILVGLACAAAVHSLLERRERLSGAFLSLGILLKFMPVVLLPILAIKGRQIRWRLVGVCIAVVALGFLASVLIWGPSTFNPLTTAATRRPEWSIYWVANSAHSKVSAAMGHIDIAWLEKPLLICGVLGVAALYSLGRISLAPAATLISLITFLFYRIGYSNYQAILLCLLSYTLIREWVDDANHKLVGVLSIIYFSFLAFSDLDFWNGGWQHIFHPYVIVLCAFILGCLLLLLLLRLSLAPAPAGADGR